MLFGLLLFQKRMNHEERDEHEEGPAIREGVRVIHPAFLKRMNCRES
jgi:hypothetical protein